VPLSDAPALKSADIGIAMGKRGSEVAREAADIILMDDNFSTIVETIRDGRRIYENIRKAVGYVFTIHIPIAFSSLLAPLLNINPAYLLLLPIHVVLLELIIDPTCSIVLERQPAEADIMERMPRNPHGTILTKGILLKSVLQGIILFASSFITYYAVLRVTPCDAALARTMGLSIIIISNLFLVIVNSSTQSSILSSLKSLTKDRVFWTVIVSTLSGLFIIMYTPLSALLSLSALSIPELLSVLGIAALSVLWYEIIKVILRTRERKLKNKSHN
jgi:Ca2+-transporting ATPase